MTLTRVQRGYGLPSLWLLAALLGSCGGDGGGGGGGAASGTGSPDLGSAVQSTNWSGYQVTGDLLGFQKVSGTWIVPVVEPSGTDTASSTWAGIGGSCIDPPDCTLVEPTLIQAGTGQDSTGGESSYYAWWEAIPGPAIQASGGPLSSESFDVRPGDRITVDIDGTGLIVWSITIVNVRDGEPLWTFNTTVPYLAAGFTAEWIVETPLVFGTGGAGQLPLSDFGTVPFSGLTVNGVNPNLDTAGSRIVLVDVDGNIRANPSLASSSGDAFNVCFGPGSCS